MAVVRRRDILLLGSEWPALPVLFLYQRKGDYMRMQGSRDSAHGGTGMGELNTYDWGFFGAAK